MPELISLIVLQEHIEVANLYRENGKRKAYNELSPIRQQMVKDAVKVLSKKAYNNLKGKTILLKAKNEYIEVGFPKKEVRHLVNDIMIKLGGGNFSERTIVHIDEIIKRAKYIETSHTLTKERKDSIEHFFRCRDRTGKEVDFKITFDPNSGNGVKYYPHAVNSKGY